MIIEDNKIAFEGYLSEARSSYAKGNLAFAAALVQKAANSAWRRHPGIFFSPEAEGLLRQISQDAFGSTFPQRERRGILHVLTTAYAVGGHTALVRRWVEIDQASSHGLALTQQRWTPVPQTLDSIFNKPNLGTAVLDRFGANAISLARKLRHLASGFSLIVLHTHPHDVVPILAFGGSAAHPPIALCNHADHVFWLGITISDTILCIRPSGAILSTRRRGIPYYRNFLLPIPLRPPKSLQWSKAKALAYLALPPDALVLLSVASSYKYIPTARADFIALHKRLLCADRRIHLVVVGPSASEEYWRRAELKSSGRIRAYGVQIDLEPFHAAATVYVDSSPFASLTSLLEAAALGIPVVSWHPYEQRSLSEILSSDDISFLEEPFAFYDLPLYRERLLHLVQQSDKGQWAGGQPLNTIQSHHCGASWNSRVNELYEQMSRTDRANFELGDVEPTSAVDIELANFQKVSMVWEEWHKNLVMSVVDRANFVGRRFFSRVKSLVPRFRLNRARH